MKGECYLDIVEHAIQFATKAHDGQYRKGSDIPYITHPFAVAMLLRSEGCPDEVVAAGLLHDTVEDTNVTLEDIKINFGDTVAHIVEGCSEPNKSLSWEERKRHTIQYLKTADQSVRLVACADKFHNLRSIRDDLEHNGEEVWKKFKRGRRQQEWYYKNIVTSLEQGPSFPLLEKLRKEIELVF